MDVFAQFDLQKIALLLDVDGTIVDIGPSPTEVHVAAGLLETLKRLFALMDGALALVSGRPIADLDRLFAPLRLPTIGGHGAEMRLRDNEVFFWAKPLPHDLRKRLAESTGIGSGVVVEDKDYSLALHCRRRLVQAPRARYPGASDPCSSSHDLRLLRERNTILCWRRSGGAGMGIHACGRAQCHRRVMGSE